MATVSESLEEAVGHLSGFVMPVQPELLSDVRAAFPDTELMSELLIEDPALCLSVLRLNSLDDPQLCQNSIRRALEELGAERISAMINAVMLIMAKKNEFHHAAFENYWETNHKVASFMTNLTRQLNIPLVEEAQCVAILHDIGIPFLWKKHPDYFELIKQHNELPLIEAENRLFRCDHATIGFYVAKGLHLNDTICDVIRYHHLTDHFFNHETNIESDRLTLLALLKMTETVVDENIFLTHKSDTREWNRIKTAALEILGLEEKDYEDLAHMAF